MLLTSEGQELQRLPAPPFPTTLAVVSNEQIFVAGEGSGSIFQYRLTYSNNEATGLKKLAFVGEINLEQVDALRGLVSGPESILYGLDPHRSRIVSISITQSKSPVVSLQVNEELGSCHGPTQAKWLSLAQGGVVLVNCLLEQSLKIYRVDDQGLKIGKSGEIHHHGPFWSFDVVAREDDLLIAAGGVEDRPLDRSHGGFGYIDSFLFIYKASLSINESSFLTERVAAINLSELGVVTPKWLQINSSSLQETEVFVTGYGSDQWVQVHWPNSFENPPNVQRQVGVPGITHVSGSLAANPLLDAWINIPKDKPLRLIPVQDHTNNEIRSIESKLGEALVFTTLMAPWNQAEGYESRFTCETCHFEGHIDGRVHYSGRADIHATTKPLRGLFNNRPHFSRALDRSMTQMVNNEFRVANHPRRPDSWFTLNSEQWAWLAYWQNVPNELSPMFLRRSLMTFLMQLHHLPNPKVDRRLNWTDSERRGAELFAKYCEDCHQARLITDDTNSRIPSEQWEALVMSSQGAIVWASDEYKKTGSLPYVHPNGTRVPSLRRIRQKWPYFTNGSARSLSEVLEQGGFIHKKFVHHHPDSAAFVKLVDHEQKALLAFLDLL